VARKASAVGGSKAGGTAPGSGQKPAGGGIGNGSPIIEPARQMPAATDQQRSRELLDFIALVMLAIKEEIEDLRQAQSRSAQAVTLKLMELGQEVPNSPAMASIIGLMQGDDLANQRQQHVVNALRYVDDLIREYSGRGWEPRLSERATGWGEGLLAGQTLEQVRAHFHHYLLDRGQSPSTIAPAGKDQDEVELF